MKCTDCLGIFVLFGRILEIPKLLDKVIAIDFKLLANKDELVARLFEAFLVHQQLFANLFAGAESRKLDFDIGVRGLSVHSNQVFGQRHNFYGLTHIEDKYFATLRDTRRFHHQAHGFRNRHKVADNIGVRHRHGLALFNLFFEQRNHGAVATKHIPETGTYKFCRTCLLLRQVLHNHFAAALGGAHHVRRVHRLVGANHHKLSDLIEQRKEGHIKGSDNVVLNRFHRAIFHQGHMLVGRRVENNIGLVGLENMAHALVVTHASDQRHQVQGVAVFHHHFLLDFVGIVLVNIDNDQLPRSILCNLAHEFATDRATATRNHADLALDKVADILVVELDRFTP